MSAMFTVKNEQARSRKRIRLVDEEAEPVKMAFEGGLAGKFRQPEYRVPGQPYRSFISVFARHHTRIWCVSSICQSHPPTKRHCRGRGQHVGHAVKNEQARSRKRIRLVDEEAEPVKMAFEGGLAGKFRQPEYRVPGQP